jgi:hypothetical protein
MLFSRYYLDRCQEFLSDGKIHVSVRTDEDVREIVKRITAKEDREEILLYIQRDGVSDSVAATTLDLCASLVAMTEVGSQDFRISARESIIWREDHSMRSWSAILLQKCRLMLWGCG